MTKLRVKAEIEDPELHVVGYGLLKLSSIKRRIKEYADKIKHCSDTGNFSELGHWAYGNGVLKAMVEAIQQHEGR